MRHEYRQFARMRAAIAAMNAGKKTIFLETSEDSAQRSYTALLNLLPPKGSAFFPRWLTTDGEQRKIKHSNGGSIHIQSTEKRDGFTGLTLENFAKLLPDDEFPPFHPARDA